MYRLSLLVVIACAAACELTTGTPEPLPDVAGDYELNRVNGEGVPATFASRRPGCGSFRVVRGSLEMGPAGDHPGGDWEASMTVNHRDCGGIDQLEFSNLSGTYVRHADSTIVFDGADDFGDEARYHAEGRITARAVLSGVVDALRFDR